MGSKPIRETLGPSVGKGLAQSVHRDGHSPTGRSSGKFTLDMFPKNTGAVLAVTVETEST